MFFPWVPLWSSKLGTWNSGKLHTKKGDRHWSRCLKHCLTLMCTHMCFMCYWWYICILPPPSGDCWESFLTREHTPQPCRKGNTGMLSALDKRGHRGSRLHSCLIVLEALICQGSAGNQVGIYSALLCLLGSSFQQRGHFNIFTLCPSAAPSCPRLMKMLWR